ncbi:MAG: HEAT repeat domain-containing protein [Chloroflexota bacterium]
MEFLNLVTPEVSQFIQNVSANTAGGLAALYAAELLRASSRAIRTRIGEDDERTAALRNAAHAAILATVKDWEVLPPEYKDIWEKTQGWLLEPIVLGEFRKLLAPSAETELDFAELRAEFDAAGLTVADLNKPDSDALIQDMVGAFYLAAAEEPLLQEPLKIGTLRELAEEMNALTRLQAQEVKVARRSLAELERLNLMADAVVDGQTDAVDLLRAILTELQNLPQDLSILQLGYNESAAVLSRAELGDLIEVGSITNGQNVAIGPHATVNQSTSSEMVEIVRQFNEQMAQIAARLPTRQDQLTEAEFNQLEQNYRQTIIDQFEMLTFRGITPSGNALTLKLEEVYVELKTIAEVPEAADTYSADERRFMLEMEGELEREEAIAHLDSLRLERWRDEARQQRQEQIKRLERRSISEAISDPTQRGLVILGDPGSGKSTLLHYLALTNARNPVGDTLPIFVPLAAYDDYRRRNDDGIALADFLAIYYEQWRSLPGLGPLFTQALNRGRALLLLDGLDEVLETPMRQHVAEQAGSFIQNWQGRGNRFVLTSRVVGYREARLPGDLPHETVLDFGRQEMEQFAHQWCRTYEIWAAGRESPTALQNAAIEEENLLGDIRSNPSVEQLAANPLLLTMLAILRRQVGKLPDRRVELYERYVRTLIDNREQERSRGARQSMPDRFDPHRAIRHLMDLALWLQQHRSSGTARRHDLEDALAEICLRYEGHQEPKDAPPKAQDEAKHDAEAFLHDMRAIAGLLAERGRDAFGFLHLTFQEYFAGRALARLKPDERWTILQPHLHKPRWREPILLCAGQLGVIEQRNEEATEFVERILDAGSEHEKILHRDLFLACSSMADNVGLSLDLLKRLFVSASTLHTSDIRTLQNKALSSLTHLARIGQADALNLLITGLDNQDLTQPILENVEPQLVESELAPLRRAIIEKLNDDDKYVRYSAVRALSGLVATDPEIRQAIVENLNNSNSYVRYSAVRALSGLVASDEEIRQTRVVYLGVSAPSSVKSWAVRAPSSLVASDEEIRQAIMEKLNDDDKDVRRAAVRALSGLVATDPEVRQAIVEKLNDGNSYVRYSAVSALSDLVASDEEIRQTIIESLPEPLYREPMYSERLLAINALSLLVETDLEVRHELLKMLNNYNEHSGKEDRRNHWNYRYPKSAGIVDVLAVLVPIDPDVCLSIATLLNDQNAYIRGAAVNALSQLVPHNTYVTSSIISLLDDKSQIVREAAINALTVLIPTEPNVCSSIIALLNDEDWRVRSTVSKIFSSAIISAPHIRNSFIRLLQDSNREIRKVAIEMLSPLLANEPEICNVLINLLHDSDSYVQVTTVEALAPLVETEPNVRKAISELLFTDSVYVRDSVIAVLAKVATINSDIYNVFITLLHDRYVPVDLPPLINAMAGLVSTETAVRNEVMSLLRNKKGGLG